MVSQDTVIYNKFNDSKIALLTPLSAWRGWDMNRWGLVAKVTLSHLL